MRSQEHTLDLTEHEKTKSTKKEKSIYNLCWFTGKKQTTEKHLNFFKKSLLS